MKMDKKESIDDYNYNYNGNNSNNNSNNNNDNNNNNNNNNDSNKDNKNKNRYDNNNDKIEKENQSILSKYKSSTIYRKPGTNTNKLSTYSLSITADDAKTNSFQKTKIPSKKELTDCMAGVFRNNFMAYDMRVAETGVLMKVPFFLLFFCFLSSFLTF